MIPRSPRSSGSFAVEAASGIALLLATAAALLWAHLTP
jgi:hypothetical protein